MAGFRKPQRGAYHRKDVVQSILGVIFAMALGITMVYVYIGYNGHI